MIATIPSAVLIGVDGKHVSVEVHVSNGLPGFTMVGLPDAAVRESRDRVRAALLSSGLAWPLRRVTVNLAPSGLTSGQVKRRSRRIEHVDVLRVLRSDARFTPCHYRRHHGPLRRRFLRGAGPMLAISDGT